MDSVALVHPYWNFWESFVPGDLRADREALLARAATPGSSRWTTCAESWPRVTSPVPDTRTPGRPSPRRAGRRRLAHSRRFSSVGPALANDRKPDDGQ